MLGRGDNLEPVAADVDLVLLTVPDDAIATVAGAIRPAAAVVAHVSGASDLTVLAGHGRAASVHPLISLPDAETGTRRLLDSCTFAVDGEPIATAVVADLGGTAIHIPAEARALYHATACIAANHLAALANQIEVLAAQVGVPVESYWKLMATTLQNVTETGSVAALTGPSSRGDWETVRKHLDAIDQPDEQALYAILSQRAAIMADQDWSQAERP